MFKAKQGGLQDVHNGGLPMDEDPYVHTLKELARLNGGGVGSVRMIMVFLGQKRRRFVAQYVLMRKVYRAGIRGNANLVLGW